MELKKQDETGALMRISQFCERARISKAHYLRLGRDPARPGWVPFRSRAGAENRKSSRKSRLRDRANRSC